MARRTHGLGAQQGLQRLSRADLPQSVQKCASSPRICPHDIGRATNKCSGDILSVDQQFS
eukprot:5783691-Pyramimonas_sp.AAC.1